MKHGCRKGARLAEVGEGLLVGLVGGHRVALRGLQSEQGRATAGREGRRRATRKGRRRATGGKVRRGFPLSIGDLIEIIGD